MMSTHTQVLKLTTLNLPEQQDVTHYCDIQDKKM